MEDFAAHLLARERNGLEPPRGGEPGQRLRGPITGPGDRQIAQNEVGGAASEKRGEKHR